MKTHKVLKRIGIILLALAAAFVLFVAVILISSRVHYNRTRSSVQETSAPKNDNALDFVVEDSQEDLVVDTYNEYSLSETTYFQIQDADYLSQFPDYKEVTPDDLRQAIRDNPTTSEKFDDLFRWYIDALEEKYPDIDLWPLYYNLLSLEVVECTTSELMLKSVSPTAYGCYIQTENKIYVNSEYEYTPGTWEYQVIIHEFCHALRSVYREGEGISLHVSSGMPEYYLVTADECLNSLFAVSLFDYEEPDIAYQFQSNMYLIMIECMDNYTLSDYVNHSQNYFASKLDETNGNHNYAWSILQLIEAQYDDYHSDLIHREQSDYAPIYEYLCKMYLNRYAAAGMDEAAVDGLIDTLVERVMFDVPEEYEVDTEIFYDFGRAYYSEMNL